MLKQREGRLVKFNKILGLLKGKFSFAYKKLKKIMWVGTTGRLQIYFQNKFFKKF